MLNFPTKDAGQLHSRMLLVDFARALAVLLIQGHALDVLLAPVYRQGALFETWLFLRGLTAPMFFLLSGISFTLASLRRWDAYARPCKESLRRLGRFAFFIILGYVMHWPAKSLQDFKYLDSAGWQGWLQVDVLQCVGFTLIVLQLTLFAAKTPKRFASLAILFSSFFVLLAPVTWAVDWSHYFRLSVASYFNASTGSLFPLYPWSGYLCLGAALGYLYVQWQAKSPAALAAPPLVKTSALLGAIGVCFHLVPLNPYAHADFWKTSPNLFSDSGGMRRAAGITGIRYGKDIAPAARRALVGPGIADRLFCT